MINPSFYLNFFFFFFFFFLLSVLQVFRISELCPAFLSHQYQLKQFLKVMELLPLESLSAILEYMFALQQEEKSKKMCHLMFSIEKFPM